MRHTACPAVGMDPCEPARARPMPDLRSAETLVGWPVQDPDGFVLGTVQQLLFDLQSGRIAYAVVASGGFVGQGESRFALTWDDLEAADAPPRLIWHGAAPERE